MPVVDLFGESDVLENIQNLGRALRWSAWPSGCSWGRTPSTRLAAASDRAMAPRLARPAPADAPDRCPTAKPESVGLVKPVVMRVVCQCSHKRPCESPPQAEVLTPWRTAQTIEVEPPARWTVALLDLFVRDLCRQANISDLTMVEFRGESVTVSGNGHSLMMPIAGLIPGSVLGPWLLSHRETGDVWSCVYWPQPVDPRGQVRQPQGGA